MELSTSEDGQKTPNQQAPYGACHPERSRKPNAKALWRGSIRLRQSHFVKTSCDEGLRRDLGFGK